MELDHLRTGAGTVPPAIPHHAAWPAGPPKRVAPRPGWLRRLPVVAVLIALTAGACTSSTNPGPTASTIAAGSPWRGTLATVVLPAPVNALHAVDCPTDTSCWAVGSTVGSATAPNGAAIISTADGGTTWSSQVIPPITGYLSAISCSDQRQCVAVGQATQSSNGEAVILATTDAGRIWQSRPIPPGFLDVTAVACRADRRCMAIGDVNGSAAALTSASAGATWVERGLLPAGVSGATGVSCPDDTHCWVTAQRAPDPDHVAGVVVLTTNGGSAWEALTTPGPLGYLNGVSCPTSGSGSGALPFSATTGPGTTPTHAGSATTGATNPSSSSTPSNSAAAAGVAGANCVVVGTTSTTLNATRAGHGVVLTTTDGGGAWSSRRVAVTTASLLGVSCTGPDMCVMVGSAVAASAPAGAVLFTGPADSPWKRTSEVDAPQPLTGASCTSPSRCVLVGESVAQHLVGG